MRKRGELIQGVHYIYQSFGKKKLIYWEDKLIEHGLLYGFKSEAHIQRCIENKKRVEKSFG